jgi:hypothetical protein
MTRRIGTSVGAEGPVVCRRLVVMDGAMMQIKIFAFALVTVTVLLVAAGNSEAGNSLHWTAKAAPGYQRMYRAHGSPSAVCQKRSALVIHCFRMFGNLGPYRTLSARLLSSTRVRYVFRDMSGKLNVTTARVRNKDWVA